MIYGVGMGLVAIHTNFHKDWFRHSKVNWGRGDPYAHRKHGGRISLLSFFQNKEMRLEIRVFPI
jgi:hypothetical protein